MTAHFQSLSSQIQLDPDLDVLHVLLAELRLCQTKSGAILESRLNEARKLVERVAHNAQLLNSRYMSTQVGQAFAADLAAWTEAGLTSRPDFTGYRDSLEAPANGEMIFALAPYLLANGPNGRGYFFEYFLAKREEPSACLEVARQYPHPNNICQSLQVLRGSPGISEGTSIVFFPENIAAPEVPKTQRFAMFFFSKFFFIYNELTVPEIHRLFGADDLFFGGAGWTSENLSRPENYVARCIWGYLHDRFHHLGPRPFNENITLKMNWFVGLLEEIKVDAQSALACLDSDIPFGREVFEFILFERSLRYPKQPDAPTNFDSGTGYFLFSLLLETGAYRPAGAGRLTTDLASVRACLQNLVAEIEALERLDTDAYRAAAEAFVRRYLPQGEGRARYRPPAQVCAHLEFVGKPE